MNILISLSEKSETAKTFSPLPVTGSVSSDTRPVIDEYITEICCTTGR